MTCSTCPGSAFTGPQFRTRDHHQIDIFANQARQHLQVFRDDSVQIENLGASAFASG